MALPAATIHTPSSNEVSLWVTIFLSGNGCFEFWFLVCLFVLCHPEPCGDEQISSLMLSATAGIEVPLLLWRTIPLKDPDVSGSSPFLFVQCINLLFSPLLSSGILPGLSILITWIQSPLGKFNPLVSGKFSNACTIDSFSFIQQLVYFAIAEVFYFLDHHTDGGRSVRSRFFWWWIHVDVWQKPTWDYKVIILQLKINTFKIKKKNGVRSTFHQVGE